MTHEREAAQWSEQAARRRRIPEPEIVAGTKSSNAGGGDVGSIVSVHVALPLFDRAAPERAAAQARARQVRAEPAALTTERCAVRSPPGAPPSSNGGRRRTAIGQLSAPAPIGSSGSRR